MSEDSFLEKNIEDYTIKDCEDFLAKYPKDIDADKVRKKLQKLKGLLGDVVDELSDSIAQKNTQSSGQSSSIHIHERHPSCPNHKLRQVVWRIIFVIACLIIGTFFIICVFDSDINVFYSGGHFKLGRFAGAGLGAISLLGWLGDKADF